MRGDLFGLSRQPAARRRGGRAIRWKDVAGDLRIAVRRMSGVFPWNEIDRTKTKNRRGSAARACRPLVVSGRRGTALSVTFANNANPVRRREPANSPGGTG